MYFSICLIPEVWEKFLPLLPRSPPPDRGRWCSAKANRRTEAPLPRKTWKAREDFGQLLELIRSTWKKCPPVGIESFFHFELVRNARDTTRTPLQLHCSALLLSLPFVYSILKGFFLLLISILHFWEFQWIGPQICSISFKSGQKSSFQPSPSGHHISEPL